MDKCEYNYYKMLKVSILNAERTNFHNDSLKVKKKVSIMGFTGIFYFEGGKRWTGQRLFFFISLLIISLATLDSTCSLL